MNDEQPNPNLTTATRLKAVVKKLPRHIGFVDGDPVEASDDFGRTSAITRELGQLRGVGAQVDVFETRTLTPSP